MRASASATTSIVNDEPPSRLLGAYAEEGQVPVEPDVERIAALGRRAGRAARHQRNGNRSPRSREARERSCWASSIARSPSARRSLNPRARIAARRAVGEFVRYAATFASASRLAANGFPGSIVRASRASD